MKEKLKKIVVVLLLSQLLLWPLAGIAEGPTATLGSVNPVPINDNGTIKQNQTFNLEIEPAKTAWGACKSFIQKFEEGDKLATKAFSFASIIGGGAAAAHQYALEMDAYMYYLSCLQGGFQITGVDLLKKISGLKAITGIPVLPSVNSVIAPNIYTANLKQQMVTQLDGEIQTYKTKLETAAGRYNVASQSVWKALLVTILINTAKSVADALVQKLVSNYKITNMKQYVDSAATLMYDNQFIRENFPSNYSQLMSRAILENPQFRNRIQPAIYVAADAALGYDPKSLSPSDPNYYSKMAMAGNSAANPYYLQTVYVSSTDQARANAVLTTQNQISLGTGYKAPVNCAGTLSQQQSIDARAKALQDRLDDRQNVYNSLLQAQKAGQTVSATDLQKAQADYNSAYTAWNNAPDAMSTSSPAIIMCEAVTSPAILVNQGIDAVMKTLVSNIGSYNDNNLPSFIKTISGIASQVASSLVLGGPGAAKGAFLVNENKLVTTVSTALAQNASNNAAAALQSGVNFTISPNPDASTPNTYDMSWSVAMAGTSASYVKILGNGLPTDLTTSPELPLQGDYALTTTSGGSYILNVYDDNKNVIATTNFVLNVNSGSGSGNGGSSSGSKVSWATASSTLAAGDNQDIAYTVTDSKGASVSSATVSPSSSDTGIAFAQPDGDGRIKIIGIAPGSATITISWTDDAGNTVTSPALNITVTASTAYNYSGRPAVAGAYTINRAIAPRGEPEPVLPRGY